MHSDQAVRESIVRSVNSNPPVATPRVSKALANPPRISGNLADVSSTEAPVVDPVRRPHLEVVDPEFRAAIECDVEHCRELLAYLRDR